MTYEKYVYANGKTYGPYLYESKRINGKVKSIYHGKPKVPLFKKIKLMLKGKR